MSSKVVIFAGLLAVIAAIEIHPYEHKEEHLVKKHHIPIVKSKFEQSKEGYKYSYETGNGIHAQEIGYVKNKGDKNHETVVQQGTITYLDEHGKPITLTYIADEHGFQPQGDHLPTPHPIPHEHAHQNHHNQHQYVQHQNHHGFQAGEELHHHQYQPEYQHVGSNLGLGSEDGQYQSYH